MHPEMTSGSVVGSGKTSLSVVLLCFNDAEVIGHCVAQAFAILEPLTSDLQVIVVEDGSHDHSRSVLLRLKTLHPRLEVIFHPRNRGYGRSLAEGIQAARNEYVLCSDGDNQFDFNDAARFLDVADGRAEIISGVRRPRADRWYRRALGCLCNTGVRAIFSLQAADVDCGFKLMNRQAAQSLFPLRSNMAVWIEAMAKAERHKYRCINMAVHHRPRESGQSTVFNPAGITRLLWEILSLIARFKLPASRKKSGSGNETEFQQGEAKMKPIRLGLLALLLFGGIALKPWTATAQKQSGDPEVIVKNAQPGDFHATPIMPPCFLGAMQRMNPETGAAVFLVRVEAKDGCVVPLHWHTSGEQITVVSGIVTLKMTDGTNVELKEGGYAYIPPKHVHLFSCSGPCVHFVQSDGPYDIHYVNKEGKEVPLAEALKGSQ